MLRAAIREELIAANPRLNHIGKERNKKKKTQQHTRAALPGSVYLGVFM